MRSPGTSVVQHVRTKMADAEREAKASEEPFKPASTRRKRKLDREKDMDTSGEMSRPSFPPAKVEKLTVKGVRSSAYDVPVFWWSSIVHRPEF